MSETPLPEDVSIEDLGEDYILVPYALQFADEDQPMPVGCVICETDTRKLTAYVMGADGEWSQTNKEVISEDNELFGATPDALYQSVIGVAGDEWSKLNTTKEKLSEFLEVESNVESELVGLAGEIPTETRRIEFCSCKHPENFEDTLLSVSEEVISVSVCKKCGGFISTNGLDSGKKQFYLDENSNIFDVEFVEEDMDANRINLTEDEDLYMYTQSGSELNSITGLGVVSWWQSQRVNPSIRSFVPTENNITVLFDDDSIIGVLIWSYMFNGIVTIRHIGLFDIETDQLEIFINTLSEEENSEIYLKKPYAETELDEFVIPVEFMSGSIQLASKPDSGDN